MLEAKADRPYCDQLVQDALKSGDSKHRELLQVAQTLRDDIVELRGVQNAVEDKLSVCMRFMSWYSDMHDRSRRSGM
jgi:TorA maturation chaperone TorD